MVPAVVVVLAAAIVAVIVLRGSGGSSPYRLSALQRLENRVRGEAAAWVYAQVSPTAVIACDPPTCTALRNQGVRAPLTTLTNNSSYPLGSALVIQTANVRSLFGSSLDNYAPVVIATFGSGNAQIEVRVIAPDGAAAYQKSLATDLASRKLAGAALVASSQISASPAARAEMSAGLVDPRLMIAITDLAGDHPVDIVDFGNLAQGASPGVPLRYVDLAADGAPAHMNGRAYVQWMLSVLSSLPADYRVLRTVQLLEHGEEVLRIECSAPSPLGMLGPTG
jgi:hypothetical protein